MKTDLFETELRDAMSTVQCPRQVDVTDAVMEAVAKRPILSADMDNRRMKWKIMTGTVAACAATVVALIITFGANHNETEVNYVVGDVTSYIESYAEPDEYYENRFDNIRTYILDEETSSSMESDE